MRPRSAMPPVWGGGPGVPGRRSRRCGVGGYSSPNSGCAEPSAAADRGRPDAFARKTSPPAAPAAERGVRRLGEREVTMVKRIEPNRPVRAYCRNCDEIQEALLWSFSSKDGARCSTCCGPLDRIRGERVPRKLRIATPDTIDYPKRESEFEVQAYLYHTLRERGFDVRGEVTSRQRSARLDLVVFNRRVAVLIIEVKRTLVRRNWARTRVLVPDSTGEQLEGYRRLGAPVRYVPSMSSAVEFCRSLELPIVQET